MGDKKRIYKRLLDLLKSRDALFFLFFLLLSTIFWFVIALDLQRDATLRVPINYRGLPDEIVIDGELPERIEISVRDKGSTLLKYRKQSRVPLAFDMEKIYFSKGKIVITQDQLRNRMASYVLPSTAVLSIKPDSIVYRYSHLESKVVPVKLKSLPKLAPQYTLSDSTLIEPAKIEIFGPKHLLDSIDAVYTLKPEGRAVSDTVNMTLALEEPGKGLKYAFDEVDVTVFVEMFTENKVELPITVINKAPGAEVRLFPHTVQVTYHVGISKYRQVNTDDIKVVFDFEEAKESNKRRYNLQVINNSKYINNLRLSPERVEFLIEE